MAEDNAIQERSANQLRLGTALAEHTKKESNYLLLVSLIGLTISLAGIIPSKIEALGIEFSSSNQQTLQLVLAAVVGYFLIGFLIHGTANYMKYLTAVGSAKWSEIFNMLEARKILASRSVKEGRRQEMPGFMELLKEVEKRQARKSLVYRLLCYIILCFDFLAPIALGLWAVISLLSGAKL